MYVLLSRILLVALTLFVVAELISGITVTGVYPAIIAALVLGILNMFVRPLLFILTLPITVLTLGLFIFIINAVLFLFAASFIEGFAVAGFLEALVGSAIVTIVSTFGNRFLTGSKQPRSHNS